MSCYDPLRAWQKGTAAPVFSCPVGGGYRVLELPCGVCVGCRLQRSRETAIRCMHEASLHEENVFATLTYAPQNLPADLGLNYRHIQLFLKRLRKAILPELIRFYVCGEYGDRTSRPHYHALLFGLSLPDRRFYKVAKSGDHLFTSKFLDEQWKLGGCIVGDVSFESAAYCARYIMKKQLGSQTTDSREIFNPETGEVFKRSHEFCRQSLKPGLGSGFFLKYPREMLVRNSVVHDAQEIPIPKYYLKLLERISPLYVAELKAERRELADRHFDDNFPKRLRVKEAVTRAKLKLLPRSDN